MKTFEFRPHVHGRPKSKIILIMKICTQKLRKECNLLEMSLG